ncbi:unnamed protein product [Dracunculus medinensis]|uniref:RNA polymerase-associated protein LEO1 n=1 Tax=Dracunculus medinensis TaxID=318479 RepID=A0A0N4U5F8_DRAME|nr:unnamed protein product [Dracunculus medinensis]
MSSADDGSSDADSSSDESKSATSEQSNQNNSEDSDTSDKKTSIISYQSSQENFEISKRDNLSLSQVDNSPQHSEKSTHESKASSVNGSSADRRSRSSRSMSESSDEEDNRKFAAKESVSSSGRTSSSSEKKVQKRAVLSSDEDEKASDNEHNAANKGNDLADIELSDSRSDMTEVSGNKENLDDDIVGTRLYPEPEQEDERPEPAVVEVNTARICPNFNEQGLYFIKVPNFLSIDSHPFDPDHYEDEFDEDDLMDEEGRSRLKLRVENTIRWRYALDENGDIIKQSNSKIVKWSDGSMSLYLGSEVFDIMVQPMQHDNHLFLRQGAGLQGHAVFKEKMVFRPHSTDSVTHRKVTLSMADRSNKSQRVKVLTAVGENPESQKAEIVRKEEERLRAQNRREAQQRRNRLRPMMRSGLSANFLEEKDEDSEGESIAAIKNKYKYGYGDRSMPDHSDSEDSDSRRLHDAKHDSGDTSDSDQEVRKQKKKIIIEDDEDE